MNRKKQIIKENIEKKKITKMENDKITKKKAKLENDKIAKKTIQEMHEQYLSLIDEFTEKYNTNKDEILNNGKMEFRYFCYRYLKYIRNIILPDIKLNNKKEAVLIEYRCFPHLEFLIRNIINKLGDEWSYTVICGNLNYNFMIDMCGKISHNIKIIRTKYDNLNQSTYSDFLSSLEFWNLIFGEKILLYQEDSIIFKSNINDFINWDYIGAPWPIEQNDNFKCVGNGGFSLRTKQCMIDVINKISIKDTKFNSDTINYMNSCNMVIGPEDVYFSLNMINYNIGKVADWNVASLFSTERIYNQNSLGGHNFWLNDCNWKNRMYKNIIKQIIPIYDVNNIEHRGGWKSIMENLENNDLFNETANIIFLDMIEKYFLWNDEPCILKKKWCGIIHCTQIAPPYLNNININVMLNRNTFIDALKNCIFIISLSQYVANYLKNELNKKNININIFVLKHPVISSDILYFNYNKYLNNNDKKIIQIGQQLRRVTTIYKININNHAKMWLTGTKNFAYCNYLLSNEMNYLNINSINKDSVTMIYTDTFEEYDELLSQNIVIIDLFDASANNTILECIVRNTPIIVNKIPAVIEYLGEEYPMYFTDINEITDLLNENNIKKTYEYLKNMNKEELMLEYFTKKIINLLDKMI